MPFSDDVDSSHIVIESSGLDHVDSLHVEIESKCVFFHKIYGLFTQFKLRAQYRI